MPLVEEGRTTGPITEAVLREYLAPILAHNIDTLVLGCTHYPLLKEAIRAVAGETVALVDSAESCAESVAEQLRQLGLLAANRPRSGCIQPFVTDEPGWFDGQAAQFLGEPTEPSNSATLPSIELE